MGDGQLIVMMLVGLLAGGTSAWLLRVRGRGILGSVVLGIIGAIIAGTLLPAMGINLGTGLLAPAIHATIGAIFVLLIPRFFKS